MCGGADNRCFRTAQTLRALMGTEVAREWIAADDWQRLACVALTAGKSGMHVSAFRLSEPSIRCMPLTARQQRATWRTI